MPLQASIWYVAESLKRTGSLDHDRLWQKLSWFDHPMLEWSSSIYPGYELGCNMQSYYTQSEWVEDLRLIHFCKYLLHGLHWNWWQCHLINSSFQLTADLSSLEQYVASLRESGIPCMYTDCWTSSAYIWYSMEYAIDDTRSLINSANNSEVSTEPCGTPTIVHNNELKQSSILCNTIEFAYPSFSANKFFNLLHEICIFTTSTVTFNTHK